MRSSVLLLVLLCVVAGCPAEGSEGRVDAQPATPDAAVADARPPAIDAAVGTVCATKEPIVQLIYTCNFEWRQCTGTRALDHEINCTIQAAGQLRFSLCDCMLGGVAQAQFTSTTICSSDSWEALELAANDSCGWDLR